MERSLSPRLASGLTSLAIAGFLAATALLAPSLLVAQESTSSEADVDPSTPADSETLATQDPEPATAEAQPQEQATPDAVPARQEPTWITELLFTTPPGGRDWLEVTPLLGQAPARLINFDDRLPRSRLDPGTPQGPAMVCTGGVRAAAQCRRVFLYRGESARGVPPPGSLEVYVDWQPGLASYGRYVLDDLPIVGARVSVVPEGLRAERPFTMPLASAKPPAATAPAEDAEDVSQQESADEAAAATREEPQDTGDERSRWRPYLEREVETDEDGAFRLPPLAPGRYVLETLLPTGRLHRSEPFELPAIFEPDESSEVSAARRLLQDDDDLGFDLGEISVLDWLAIGIVVVDHNDEPVAGAEISARQGRSQSTLVSFRARSDADGRGRLSGFNAELPMQLECRALGHESMQLEFDLLPVDVRCILPVLAKLEGSVLDVAGEIPPGATVALHHPEGAPALALAVDADGRFSLDIPAAELRLSVAAPGYQAEHQDLQLEFGQVLDVGTITLSPGRILRGRVVEALKRADVPFPFGPPDEERIPIPGAEIEALDPPGAARAETDADGNFIISGIGDSELVLRVSAEGYAATRIRLSPEAQRREEPVAIEMHPGGWIRAVVGSDGDPCAGCRLNLAPNGPDLVTDSDGEALSPPLLPGWYRVERARSTNLGSTVVSLTKAESRRVRVVAGEISTVRFEADLPQIRVLFEDSLDISWWLVSRTPLREERVEPETDGSFLVPYLRGTSPDLFLTRFDKASGHEMEVRVATLRVGTLSEQLDEPRLLPLPKGRVHGRVENEDSGLAGIRVRLQRVSDGAHFAEMKTAVDGRFELPYVPAGVYSLVLGERAFQFVTVDTRSRVDMGDFQLYKSAF